MDIQSSTEFSSNTDAIHFFKQARRRLLSVNTWSEQCKLPSARFMLMNGQNQYLDRLAKEGDLIRIDIPGPGTKVGEGFDWVRIENIVEMQNLITMTVRPTRHPLKPEAAVAHFFEEIATSTFQVKREGLTVWAEVHGRNESGNNKKGILIDKLRNTLVSWTAKLGLSYPQWKLLVEALIRR